MTRSFYWSSLSSVLTRVTFQCVPGKLALRDTKYCSLPAGFFCKKKVAKRPGYMRTEALQQIEFQLPSDCEPFSPEGLECRGRTNYRDFKNCSQKRQCKTELGLFHCSSYMNSTQAGLDVAPGLRTAGNAAESLTYQANLREQQPENLILPVCPLVAVCKGDPSQEEERMHTLSQKEIKSLTRKLQRLQEKAVADDDYERGKTRVITGTLLQERRVQSRPSPSQPARSRLSPYPPPPQVGRRPRSQLRSCREDMELTTEELAELQREQQKALAEEDSTEEEEDREEVSSDAIPSIIQKWNECQDFFEKHHPNISVRKSQKKQWKNMGGLQTTDKFRRKLEELEKEKSSLTFQLPSRHPSISCFLDRFRVQVQVTLYGDVYRGSRQQKSEEKILSLPCQEKIKVSATKREQLVKEKEWIQKEIEVLRARLALLEAKDRQLQIEIQEQEQLIQAEDCELSSLLSWVSHQELQAIGKALADASDASHKIPHSLDFPESIKRLQEKEQSLSMAIKDTAGKICTSQKLCSILRRKVSDIETQLPALLEAKMLAVSGGNFCIAKDLAEEIKSLMAERDRLEKLLSEWSLLSSQNAQNLERMKESHKRLKEDMEQGQAAFGEAVAVLNRCLAEVMGWMRANKLSLNPDKMEVLL
ncbi:hypothetical protein EYD10_00330, partial [Varanus komodoensis]